MNRLCLILLAAFCVAAPLPAQSAKVNLTGTVFPDDTDPAGNPLSVFIEVQGKDDSAVNYYINPEGKGRDLLLHLYTTVSVTGQLVTEGGKNRLTVIKFIKVDNPPEDLDDL